MRAQVLGLVAEHLRPSAFYKAKDTVTDGAFRRLAQKVDLELLVRFARSDCHGRTGTFDCSAMDWFLERARTLGVEHKPPAPILLGRHLIELGVQPGPRMGEILRAVYELQLDSVVTTLDEAIQRPRAGGRYIDRIIGISAIGVGHLADYLCDPVAATACVATRPFSAFASNRAMAAVVSSASADGAQLRSIMETARESQSTASAS